MGDSDRRGPSWVVGLTALMTGLVLLLGAAWLLNDGTEPTHLAQSGARWLATGTALLAIAALACRWLMESDRDRRTAALMVAALLVAVGATAYAVVDSVRRYGGGFVGSAGLLGAVGGVAAVVGLLMMITSRRPGPAEPAALDGSGTPTAPLPASIRPRSWWTVVGAAGTVLLIAAVSTTVVATADRWPVRATTIGGDGSVLPVPSSVSAVAWTASVPGPVQEVVAAGAGAVVRLRDGLVALDGAEGSVRWSYRRLGARTDWVVVSPDRRTVVTSFLAAGAVRIGHVVVFDAMTGQVRSTFTTSGMYSGHRVLLADRAIVEQEVRGGGLRAHPTMGNGPEWTWQSPADCSGQLPKPLVATSTTVLVAVACGAGNHWTARYLTLDASSGREVRQAELPLDYAGLFDVHARVATDGSLVLLAPVATVRKLLDPATGAMSEVPLKGALLLRSDGLALHYTSFTSPTGVVDARTGATKQPAGPVASCAARGIALAGGVVCVYSDDKGWMSAFADTGHAPVLAASFGASTLTSLSAGLGRQVTDTLNDHSPLFGFAATPGAIVVYTTATAVADNRVVGLR